MKVRKIEIDYRLDLFIIRYFGIYSEYYVSVLSYFNPRIDFLNLRKGTALNVPTASEISKIKKVRGYFNLVGN